MGGGVDIRLSSWCNRRIGRFNVSGRGLGLDLIVGVLRRGEDQFLGIIDEDNFLVFFFFPLSSDHPV